MNNQWNAFLVKFATILTEKGFISTMYTLLNKPSNSKLNFTVNILLFFILKFDFSFDSDDSILQVWDILFSHIFNFNYFSSEKRILHFFLCYDIFLLL